MTRKHLLGGVAALLLMAGTAAANDFTTWDTNQDSKLDATEFGTGFGSGDTRTRWDTNGDGRIQQEEFAHQYNGDATQYGAWDSNGDGDIDANEMGTGQFSQYDQDKDGFLDDTEARKYFDAR